MQVGIDMGIAVGGSASAAALGGGKQAMLDLEELLATRLLVQGNSGSGKSHLLRRLLEQSAQWVQQCIVDPEGDFVTLADMYGHVVVDAARTEAELTRIAGRIRQHRVSVVLNLEGLDVEQQMRSAAAFLGGLFDAERDYWYPMLVVVDEAQLFAPAAAGEVSDEASNFLMGRTFLDIDMARAADLLGMERRQAEMFRDLQRGHFVALGPALSRRPLPIKIGKVETSARSSSPKLMPLPDTPEDARDLIFTPAPEEIRTVARRTPPPPPPPSTAEILAQVAKPKPEAEPVEAPLFPGIVEAEREELLEKVMREIVDDPEASFRSVAVLYQDFLVRCRIHRVPGEPLALPAFRRRLAVAQASIESDVANGETWQQALALSESLTDDVQGVFLIVAQAAVTGAPCPSDAALARAYGTHSFSRARRLLTYFEERGLLVVRNDFKGMRIVNFPDLGCETAPGDPNAPDDQADMGNAAE